MGFSARALAGRGGLGGIEMGQAKKRA